MHSLLIKEQGRYDEDKINQAITQRELPINWRYLEIDEIKDKLQQDNVEENILRILSKSTYITIRVAVALHMNTPKDILESLSKGLPKDTGYERWIIQDIFLKNPLPKELVLLSNEELCKELAKDKTNNVSILKALAKTSHFVRRELAATNPNTPQSILEERLQDEDSDVRYAAKQSLKSKGLLKQGEDDDYDEDDD